MVICSSSRSLAGGGPSRIDFGADRYQDSETPGRSEARGRMSSRHQISAAALSTRRRATACTPVWE